MSTAEIYDIADLIFQYDQVRMTEVQEKIVQKLVEKNMSPLYLELAAKYSWTLLDEELQTMQKKNQEELQAIDDKIEDAKKNAGDTDVVDGMFAKAKYFFSIGDWSKTYEAYDAIISKPKIGTSKKIDAHMEKARAAIFTLDINKMKETISEAKKLNESGGDWDRRNRLKVYEALYLLTIRDVKQASVLLLDSIATFTCTELCSYTQFMFYTLVISVISLDRTSLRKKIIDDPHVITTSRELPVPKKLVSTIYSCDYQGFFQAILEAVPGITSNRYLSPIATYLIREYRVLAYAQFLEAYKSVMLSSMSASFGISTSLLDAELSRFIAAGRLNAKIDKVGDIVETRRPDKKNAQYNEVIKKGDLLLNQIQKLVRAIDV